MANGFTKKSVGTLTLGEKLKKLREERRISLNDISRLTKIQVKYLESLETGDYDNLPADVYTRGFLRSCADYFGIDEKIFLKLYEKEKGIKMNMEKDKKKTPAKKKPVNISSFVFTPKKIIVSSVILLVLFGAFLLYREIGAFSSAPRLVILDPKDNSETNNNTVSVDGITDKDASLFINGQPVLVGDDGKFAENLALQTGVNAINIKAVDRFEKETDKTVTIKSNFEEPIPSSPDNSNQPNDNGGNSNQDSGQNNPASN
jgi:cytoskeletal protein RodZ